MDHLEILKEYASLGLPMMTGLCAIFQIKCFFVRLIGKGYVSNLELSAPGKVKAKKRYVYAEY